MENSNNDTDSAKMETITDYGKRREKMRNILITVTVASLITANAIAGPRQDDEDRARRSNAATAASKMSSVITPEVLTKAKQWIIINRLPNRSLWIATSNGLATCDDGLCTTLCWDGSIITTDSRRWKEQNVVGSWLRFR